MFKQKTAENSTKNSMLIAILKGAFWGVAFSLICILIFAFIIKFTSISENAIQPINQIIKVLSILFACFIARKKLNSNGWLSGIFIGICYTILAFLIFSILDGHFSFGLNVLNDLVFGSIIGMISGILCISLKRK